MIKKELYQKTVDILYQAYFNDTLVHGDCCSCAIGNMVAANCGYKLVKDGDEIWWGRPGIMSSWNKVFFTDRREKKQVIDPCFYDLKETKKEIDSTGYTWQELAKIEYAFEMAPEGNSDEDYVFNGLVAVLGVLAEIHQIDEATDTVNRTRFSDRYAERVGCICKPQQ